ncbi:hypothetical protein [Methanoculleus caldifontis]|nr:hypothetical protein [Methanoculleus sp. Wushi-C6]
MGAPPGTTPGRPGNCPCRGSRYDTGGRVIESPAVWDPTKEVVRK